MEREYTAGPWFTLTELQERLNIDQRHNLRKSILDRGAPHVIIGRETVFATELFVDWIKANSQIKPTPEGEI